jgi:hypothetical protein
VRRTRRGAQLWLVQRGYEEWVVDPLDRSDLAGGVDSCDLHAVLVRNVLHLGRQAIRTARSLNRSQLAVEPGKARPFREIDADRLVLERAGKQRDDGRATGTVLSVRRIEDPSQASSVLDQHVLKATSSADQWHATLSRRTHYRVHRLRIAVWAPGPNHDRRSRNRDEVDVTDPLGRDDSDLDWAPALLRGMAEGGDGGGVMGRVRRQINQYRDDESAHL